MSILLFLIETKLGRTIAITVAIVAGVLIGWLVFKTHYFNLGWKAAIAAIAAQDQNAIDAANEARATVKACRDSGHTWNVENGECQ